MAKLPNWIYRSERIGKNGKPFSLLKIRTIKVGTRTSFAEEQHYTKYGRFLRKIKADELPQIINILKGDMAWFGPRANFQEFWDIAPEHIKKKILSVKPGLLSPASLYFHDEEKLLQGYEDKYKTYYTVVQPMKFALDSFYIEHRCVLLNLALIWITIKVLTKSLFNK